MSINNNTQTKIEVEEPDSTFAELDKKYNLDINLIESENELYFLRNKDYMSVQQFIEPVMRSLLLDWMMDICNHFKFKRNTYHSAYILIDLYLSKVRNVPTSLLQLVGVVCLCIAAKNEVIYIFSFYILYF